MMKKMLCLWLAVCLCTVSMTGCAQTPVESSSSDNTGTTVSTVSTDAATTTQSNSTATVTTTAVTTTTTTAAVTTTTVYQPIDAGPVPTLGVHFTKENDPVNVGTFLSDKPLEKAPNSVEAWLKLDPGSVGGAVISDLFSEDPAYIGSDYLEQRSDASQFSLYVDTLGHPCIMWYTGEKDSFKNKTGSFFWCVEDVDLRTEDWVHIAFTRDVKKGTVSFYLNGKLHATQTAVCKDYTLERRFGIGCDTTTAAKMRFRGRLAHVAVWDDCRTAAEIAQSLKGPVKADAADLMAYWPLTEDGTSTSVLEDVRGNYHLKWYPIWVSEAEMNVPAYDYSIVLLPDVQFMTRYRPMALTHMTEWIAQNKSKLNLQAVLCLGDLCNGNFYGSRAEGEWEQEAANAAESFKVLEEANIPYLISLGNHDYDETKTNRDSSLLNSHFSADLIKSYDTFGGLYEQDKIDNAYLKLHVNGNKWLLLALEFGPRNAVIDWANKVIADHPDYNVIVTSHDGVSKSAKWSHSAQLDNASHYPTIRADANDGIDLWNKLLSKHRNIKAFFNGHWDNDFIQYRTDVGEKGNTVHSFMIDFTSNDVARDAQELLTLLTFSNGGKTLTLSTYSTVKNAYFMGYENQFTFTID